MENGPTEFLLLNKKYFPRPYASQQSRVEGRVAQEARGEEREKAISAAREEDVRKGSLHPPCPSSRPRLRPHLRRRRLLAPCPPNGSVVHSLPSPVEEKKEKKRNIAPNSNQEGKKKSFSLEF